MPARGRTGHRRLTIAVDPGGDASYKSVMPLPAPLPADGPLRPACTVLCAVCLAGVPAPPTRAEGPPTPQYMCIVNGVDDAATALQLREVDRICLGGPAVFPGLFED